MNKPMIFWFLDKIILSVDLRDFFFSDLGSRGGGGGGGRKFIKKKSSIYLSFPGCFLLFFLIHRTSKIFYFFQRNK